MAAISPDSTSAGSPTKSGRSPLVFAIAALGVAVILGLPAFRAYRTESRNKADRERLKQIALALQNYHDAHGSFPPAYVLGPSGERFHSWRVLVLPYLRQKALYDEYRFDEPWSSPHNRAVAEKSPDIYRSELAAAPSHGIANFLAVAGRATSWPEQYCVQRDQITDGPSNTIQLINRVDSEIPWTDPRDLAVKEAMALLTPKDSVPASPQKGALPESFLVAMADGAVRRVKSEISRDIFRGLLSIDAGKPLAGVDWPADEIPDPGELPPPRPATEFPRTDMLPHPFGTISPGRNSVYCATFAIAWDDACKKFGGRPLRLSDDPPLAEALNRHRFDRRNLAQDSYLAAAGSGNKEFRDKLLNEIRSKFPNARPTLVDPNQSDHQFELYAYLLKQLPFQNAFDRLNEPLRFVSNRGDESVVAFGMKPLGEDFKAEQVRTQITVLDYVHDNDFVLQLTPARGRDQIVLAKVTPAETLEETIAAVRSRITSPDSHHSERQCLLSEPLVIPELLIGIERDYSEIVSKSIAGTDQYIVGAWQIIKFHLDETGAVLESEARIVTDFGGPPAGRRKFIFDRPFLIYLIERDADQPYFAAWIANSELMVPSPK
jgi:hypothetical protein